ncbi:transposase [Carnobacterium maltaromaticum]|uniref:transposase n=1 Tax=Carnobacterium maltaromaticum TaxID=2751 RepID=UPI003B9806D0
MKYEETFKKHCVNLVVKEGHSKASVTKEFNLSQGLIKTWVDAHERSIDSTQIELEQRQRELEKEK